MKPQTSGLVVGKLKRKIFREPLSVALHGKIQRFGGHAVELSEVGIQHHLLAADQKYSPLDLNSQGLRLHWLIREHTDRPDLPLLSLGFRPVDGIEEFFAEW